MCGLRGHAMKESMSSVYKAHGRFVAPGQDYIPLRVSVVATEIANSPIDMSTVVKVNRRGRSQLLQRQMGGCATHGCSVSASQISLAPRASRTSPNDVPWETLRLRLSRLVSVPLLS